MFVTPTATNYEEKNRVVKLDDDEEARLASVATVPGHSVTGGRPSKKPAAVGGGHASTPSGGSFLIMDSGGENAPSPSSVIPPAAVAPRSYTGLEMRRKPSLYAEDDETRAVCSDRGGDGEGEGEERRAGDHRHTAASSFGMARRRSLRLGGHMTPCA
jgi:hypothetical protein